ncbi:hypothetical protein ACLPHM_01935 [Paenalcaligenes sp. Me131]|uniref:hypothetical protein n=1 Tax=Paenalcaligenes sp. Me131 TaxID=3392636 RepID=UPI003D2A6FB8
MSKQQIVLAQVFKRNPDVIVEALALASSVSQSGNRTAARILKYITGKGTTAQVIATRSSSRKHKKANDVASWLVLTRLWCATISFRPSATF